MWDQILEKSKKGRISFFSFDVSYKENVKLKLSQGWQGQTKWILELISYFILEYKTNKKIKIFSFQSERDNREFA